RQPYRVGRGTNRVSIDKARAGREGGRHRPIYQIFTLRVRQPGLVRRVLITPAARAGRPSAARATAAGPHARERKVRPDREFDEFYRASHGRVVAMLTAILGDRAAAEDAAQEAFARALARWRRVAGYDLPEAWVRRVALRLAADHGRRARRAVRLASRLSAVPPPAAASDPADGLAYSPVGAALAGLSRAEREVLILHYVAGLPVAAI